MSGPWKSKQDAPMAGQLARYALNLSGYVLLSFLNWRDAASAHFGAELVFKKAYLPLATGSEQIKYTP